MKKITEQREFYNRYLEVLRSKLAFTMAEILISLTIIGIIAAITLPILRANINEKTWNTQRKALFTRMSQALGMMESINGYGLSTNQTETNTNATMAFVTQGLNKVLKINNICKQNELSKCGIPNSITTMANSPISPFPRTMWELNSAFYNNNNPQKNMNTNAVAFETPNGESVVVYYNPSCVQPTESNTPSLLEYSQTFMCANFIYDLNGLKGPNKVGKDIGFITALFPTKTSIVAPMPLETKAKNGDETTMNYEYASAACKTQDSESKLPNINALTAMFYNQKLIGMHEGPPYRYWSSSHFPTTSDGHTYMWAISNGSGGTWIPNILHSSQKNGVWCIKQ